MRFQVTCRCGSGVLGPCPGGVGVEGHQLPVTGHVLGPPQRCGFTDDPRSCDLRETSAVGNTLSCLDSFQFHRIQISVTSTPSASSSLDCFRTLRAVVHFAHFARFSYIARTDHMFPRSLILPLRPDLGVLCLASQFVSPKDISPIP